MPQTTNAEEAKVEWFYEDLQDLLAPTPKKKDVLFFIGAWHARVGSQEIPGATGKFGLGVQGEAGQRLTELYQENILIIANTLFQQHKNVIILINTMSFYEIDLSIPGFWYWGTEK